jgi:transposase
MSNINIKRLSLRQVAERYGVHPSTAARWANDGVRGRKLPTVLIGGRRFVREDDLDAFIDSGQDKNEKR